MYFFPLFPCLLSGFLLGKLLSKCCCGLAFWRAWLQGGGWQVEGDMEEDESLQCCL